MKKLISVIISMTIALSAVCTSASAVDVTEKIQLDNFEYTDKTSLVDDTMSIMSYSNLDEYEPNDLGNPYDLGTVINATTNPIETINASLSFEDTTDAYEVGTIGTTYAGVEEVVVLITGLSVGDEVEILVTNSNYYSDVTIKGTNGSGGYICIPSLNPTLEYYNIYIAAVALANQELDYTLQIASRYNHSELELGATPSSLYNRDNSQYSSPADIDIPISSVPRSAVVETILTQGRVIINDSGRETQTRLKITHGSVELYAYAGPVEFIDDLLSQNIPLRGTWSIQFMQNNGGPCTYVDISLKFYYKYDILDV